MNKLIDKKTINKFYKSYNKLTSILSKQLNKYESRKNRWNRLTAEAGKSDFM